MFGPGGFLFAVVGEAANPGNSQNLDNDAGKILRMTATGGIPPDNPFGNLVWAYGIRNSFGFDFDPLTQLIWESENGPFCNDELNLIDRGANLGWGPTWTCDTPPPPPENTNQDGPDPVLPAAWYETVFAPVGVAFCDGCGITDADGDLFFGGWLDSAVRQVTLTADRMGVASQAVVYTHSGRPISFEVGPDGAVYFSDTVSIWKLIES